MIANMSRFYMPWWLFKKSQPKNPVAEAPAAVTYSIGEEKTEQILKDSSHKETADYQAAMALFGNEKTPTGKSNSTQETEEPSEVLNFEWIAHTDGYHYKKMNDGKFEPTPYVKNSDGDYVPYS